MDLELGLLNCQLSVFGATSMKIKILIFSILTPILMQSVLKLNTYDGHLAATELIHNINLYQCQLRVSCFEILELKTQKHTK